MMIYSFLLVNLPHYFLILSKVKVNTLLGTAVSNQYNSVQYAFLACFNSIYIPKNIIKKFSAEDGGE